MSEETVAHEEIIIVRRSHDDHDDHHGGAWKVAFADFMTAMMAFFLVMWLINASNEETKKAVASYFNPIKLTDRVSNPKGVRTPKYGDTVEDDSETAEESTIISSPKANTIKAEGAAQTFDEQALFADPYSLLAEISGGIDRRLDDTKTQSDKKNTGSSNLGLSGGDAFEDPFDPAAWSMNYGVDRKGEIEQPEDPLEELEDGLAEPKRKNAAIASEKLPDGTLAKDAGKDDENDSKSMDMVRKEILQIVKAEGVHALDVKVSGDKNGTVITLFDKSKSGMFTIGSARPSPELVRIMKKIGEVLSREKGKIIVSGHTDGRKFRSDTYDNWRLSTARAHMAYYMLVRGGIPKKRFEMIRGFGDVKLAVPDDPFSPVNRRIEISLRVS